MTGVQTCALPILAGLFARRCFNIDSLVVGETDNSDVSCMTIVSSGDERTIEQIEKQLNKKLDVIKVKTFAEQQCIARELMLIKIRYNKGNRREIMELCEIMKAQIVDMSKHFMMIQICDEPEKIKLMIKMLQTISIVEVPAPERWRSPNARRMTRADGPKIRLLLTFRPEIGMIAKEFKERGMSLRWKRGTL